MDAEFLNLTVNDALLEALTATAIANPKDKIDYLGNYLMQYVNRNKKKRDDDKNAFTAKEIADKANLVEKEKQDIIDNEKKQEETRKVTSEEKIKLVCENSTSKKEAMDAICEICADYLKVPSVYIAERSIVDETEYLNYLSANSSQSLMIGKRLVKFTEDNDDKPERQGISFDVFNIPETEEEEEEPEEDEDGNPIPKKEKAPLKLPPLIIDNVMRNKDVKFYGIPKLGSAAILPFSYESTDHDSGCNIEIIIPEPQEENEEGKEEDEEGKGEEEGKEEGQEVEIKEPIELQPITKYNPNKIKKEFIIVMDTIGNYRSFLASDIEWLDVTGQLLMSSFERLDKIQFDNHVLTLQNAIGLDGTISQLINDIEIMEAKVVEVIDKRFNIPPVNEDGEGEDNGEDEQDEDKDENEDKPPPGENEEEKQVSSGTIEVKEEIKLDIELDPETEEPHELLQLFRTAQAIEKLWKKKLTSDEIYVFILKLQSIEIPPPMVILTLFESLAKFLDLPTQNYKDLFNNISWEIMKKVLIPDLKFAIESYDCSKLVCLSSPESSLEAIRGICESNSLFDSNTYTSVLPSEGLCSLLRPLYIWLQKAIAARDAAISFYQEAKEISLEVSKDQN